MSRFILRRNKIVTSESFHKKGVRSERFLLKFMIIIYLCAKEERTNQIVR